MNFRIIYSVGLLSFVSVLLFYSCEKELSTTPDDPPPPTGLLRINSVPAGSAIWLDGKNTGRTTPDSIPWIEAKDYTITLKRYRWKDTTFTMTAVENVKVERNIDYLANPSMYGSIHFNSTPSGAIIYFNDSLINSLTPHTITGLIPGRYKVRYEKENHRHSQFFIDVFSSKVSEAVIRLRDTSVWVDYQTHNSEIPTNNLLGVGCDSNNIKWIITGSKGLLKYDEHQFTVINSSNSPLPSHNIFTLEIDNENRKWLGTDKGLAIFDDFGNWKIYNTSNSNLPNDNVTAIEFNDDYTLQYIGTNNNLVSKIGDHFDKLKFLEIEDGVVIVSSIQFMTDSLCYVGTTAYGLYKYVTKFGSDDFLEVHHWSKLPTSLNSYLYGPTMKIAGLCKSKDGFIWIGSNFDVIPDNGVIYVNDSGFQRAKTGGVCFFNGSFYEGDMTLTAGVELKDMVFDNNNVLWVATENGLVRYEAINLKKTFRAEFNGISSNSVSGVIKDKNGIVWATTTNAGLNKYKAERINTPN